jgi:hypothetical protein
MRSACRICGNACGNESFVAREMMFGSPSRVAGLLLPRPAMRRLLGQRKGGSPHLGR